MISLFIFPCLSYVSLTPTSTPSPDFCVCVCVDISIEQNNQQMAGELVIIESDFNPVLTRFIFNAKI